MIYEEIMLIEWLLGYFFFKCLFSSIFVYNMCKLFIPVYLGQIRFLPVDQLSKYYTKSFKLSLH